jgi:hypothetical protein
MTEDQKRTLVELAVKQQTSRPKPEMGAPTRLTCPSCAGVLHDAVVPLPKLYNGPPKSKNRRIRKKQLKRWFAKTRLLRMVNIAIGAMGPRGWVCAGCHRRVGFYEGIARNMFKVEPLPPVALPIYDRDPEVGAIVTLTVGGSEEPV